MPELFRREAVKHAQRRLAGQVTIAAPLGLSLLTWGFISVLGAVVLFACLASYSRKETVAGWVVPEGGLIRVAARQPGHIDKIAIRDGDTVHRGDHLATLRLSSDLEAGSSGLAILRMLDHEGAEAKETLRIALRRVAARYDELRAKHDSLIREVDSARAKLAVLVERQQLAEAQVLRAQKLKAQGFLSDAGLDNARSSALAISQQRHESEAAVLSYARELELLKQQLRALPLEESAAQAQHRQNHNSLIQKRVSAEAQHTLVATAPINGRVVALPIEQGQSLAAGATIAVLSPQGSSLIAELFVPSRAAGFIRQGQPVRLMYQAFPYQTFGTGKGRVIEVSRTVLAPADVAIPGLSFTEPVFRVRVGLEASVVTAYGENVPLQPGMLLSADIVVERRSLIRWLLNPLYAAGRRG